MLYISVSICGLALVMERSSFPLPGPMLKFFVVKKLLLFLDHNVQLQVQIQKSNNQISRTKSNFSIVYLQMHTRVGEGIYMLQVKIIFRLFYF